MSKIESDHQVTAVQIVKEISWLLANKKGLITPERCSQVFQNKQMEKMSHNLSLEEASNFFSTIPEKSLREIYCKLHQDNGKFENTSFLGVHTLIPKLLKAPDVFLNTILRGNGGKLPPYSICMGDKRRVRFGASLFDSGTMNIFEHTMLSNGQDCGRVEMATGLYKGTPIVLFEHQMGCPPVEIVVKEVLSDECMTQKFNIDNSVFASDSKYLIRVGSCGGINHPTTPSSEAIKPYDIIVASHQVGISSTDVQAITGNLNPLDPQYASGAKKTLKKYGYKFHENWPVIDTDKEVSLILAETARKNIDEDGNVHILGNVSKDSLYAEAKEEAFTDLRKNHAVGSTEMELSTIMKLCKEFNIDKGIPVRVGMISVALGVLPGESFGNDHAKGSRRTKAILLSVMETYHSISQAHKRNRKISSNI